MPHLQKEKTEAFFMLPSFRHFIAQKQISFSIRAPSPQGVHRTPSAAISILAFCAPSSIISTTCALRKRLEKISRQTTKKEESG